MANFTNQMQMRNVWTLLKFMMSPNLSNSQIALGLLPRQIFGFTHIFFFLTWSPENNINAHFYHDEAARSATRGFFRFGKVSQASISPVANWFRKIDS